MACNSNLRLAEENEGRKADMTDIVDNVPRGGEKAWKRVTLAKKLNHLIQTSGEKIKPKTNRRTILQGFVMNKSKQTSMRTKKDY